VADLRLTLEYDGTDFQGWQRQAEGTRTVQQTLEEALGRLLGTPSTVVGAGRTDAGVHAEGQVASLRLDASLGPAELWRALNALLPPDLAVVDLAAAPPGFHARRDARRKTYRYRIWNAPLRSPLRARFSHHVASPLDVAAMAAAARLAVGTHDFRSFQTAGSEVGSSVRTLYRAEVLGRPGDEIRLEVEGDGFLRHMVRNLVGSLLRVGLGRAAPDSLAAVLAARDRASAGAAAPGHGLTLVRVDY
jgi:tRNA pseudouridine38-40 synthase